MIIFNLANVKFDDFSPNGTVSTTRGHLFKLFKENYDVNVRKIVFSQLIVNVWNSLPSEISSLRSFKRILLNL